MNRTRTAALALAFALGAALPAAGQQRCDVAPAAVASYTAPLDRAITARTGSTSIQTALERVAAAAHIRISYSRDLLPAHGRTCLALERVPLGAALAHILRGTQLRAVVTGSHHVVLTASAPAPGPVTATSAATEPVIVLDRIAVNAEATHATAATGVAATALDGRMLERQGAASLADALNGAAPGVWVWPQGSSLFAQYGSVRGASSFTGMTAPRVYLDGVEVANPQLFTSLDAANIERIEMVRGPQSAAYFGADAISGVTQIFTRQAEPELGAAQLRLRSGLGLTGTAFSGSRVLQQSHGVTAALGDARHSARMDVSFSSLGEYVPEAAERSTSVMGSARTLGERFSLALSTRFVSQQATLAASPLLAGNAAPARRIGMEQFTAGATLSLTPSERWLHTLVAGVSGYGIVGAPAPSEARSAADSALIAAGDRALRTTLRLTSATHRDIGNTVHALLTLTGEHSLHRQDGGLPDTPLMESGARGPMVQRSLVGMDAPALDSLAVRERRSSVSAGTRVDLTIVERVRLAAAMRAEQTSLEGYQPLGTLLPSLGASWLAHQDDRLAVTLRTAYGRGVRWPQVNTVGGAFPRRQLVAPEIQAGFEGGIDVRFGESLELQLTRFAQQAHGLELPAAASDSALHELHLRAEHVGAIRSNGWEIASSVRAGAIALNASLALVDSRVTAVSSDYSGDLRTGDRVLGVPALTWSVGAAYTRPAWSLSAALTRAADWIDYDRLALADAGSVSGNALRDYWIRYDGVTRLRATLGRDFGPRFSIQLLGDNLLDAQTGAPDNVTVLPGRHISLGVRTKL